MGKDWSTLELLRHARHDWLNQLQLIKANLSMGRTERAKEIIEEIILISRHESNLMNLKVPELAEYLITFNWLKHPIVLETEVAGEARDLSKVGKVILEACQSLFAVMNRSVNPLAENRLVFTISNQQHPSAFMFRLTGSIHNTEEFESELKDVISAHKLLDVIESYIQPHEVFLVLQMKQ
ncbi:sporulation initiation phosphotransferase B [Fictibacillus sp. WQ 8-8]|uniref:Spo0B C-terminal domain-containing protein n=1 Tax=unclassified Fictibacillus TaxID=2644029 RepID=UPI00210B9CBD|nr:MULTISPECIES: Spo0B C-terminal domain-containing protein [unclassified Fictibacillus]MCQ6266424.1 sporulation initiation phosphotransferase B [Fictibacillus sp. WQ 8-8]MED2972913.1 Spo0B C-terminal domain-containing protein [Fictibacillus sp. B-59209]